MLTASQVVSIGVPFGAILLGQPTAPRDRGDLDTFLANTNGRV